MLGLVLPPKVTFLALGGIDFHLLYEVNIIYLRSTDSHDENPAKCQED